MKKRSVVNAYDPVCPDVKAKERMLQNILLSSEISPPGKDERKMRKKMKPIVIAAIISLMLLLMGSAVISLGLQDLKISEFTAGSGEILGSDGNLVKETELHGAVISLHGILDTPTYLAHQEWYEFYQEFAQQHEITEEENYFIPPEEYEAYTAYNQELMDKIDEIAGKYDLKLLGAFAPFQKSEKNVFYQATGVNSLLTEDSVVSIRNESGYFYQGGNFKVEFDLELPQDWENMPPSMSNCLYYSKADYFDTIYYVIGDLDNWEQWEYTTKNSADLLITRAKSGFGVRIFHVREDAILYLSLNGYYEEGQTDTDVPTNRQIELIAEQFDYSIAVESVDMELAKSQLHKFTNSSFLQNEDDVYDSFEAIIQDKLSKVSDTSSLYYALNDINEDGEMDLIIGSETEIESVWMIKYGQINRIMEYGENYKQLKDNWPEMEKDPITEYTGQ